MKLFKLFAGYERKGLLWRGYCVGIPIDADGHVKRGRFMVRSFWGITPKGIKNKMRKNLIVLTREIEEQGETL